MPTKKSKTRLLFFQALGLTLAVFLTRIWVNSPFSAEYNLLLTILILFLSSLLFFAREKNLDPSQGLIWETILFTVVLLLLLSATGGLYSSFFFLAYFLLFAVGLLFPPLTTFILSLALVFFLVQDLNTLHGALQLFSLLLITPLAIYFGRQYVRLLAAKKKIRVLTEEGQDLEKALEKEETASLLWLSLNFKNGLLKIAHQTSELLADIGHLTFTQKESLQSIYETAKTLLKSGRELQEKIDQETDK